MKEIGSERRGKKKGRERGVNETRRQKEVRRGKGRKRGHMGPQGDCLSLWKRVSIRRYEWRQKRMSSQRKGETVFIITKKGNSFSKRERELGEATKFSAHPTQNEISY